MGSAAVTPDAVVIGAEDGRVWSLDRSTGKPRWDHLTRGGPVYGSPVVAGGRVYIGTEQRLYVLDAATGKKVQELPLDGDVRGSVAVAGGCVLVATDNGTLYAFGAKE